MTQRAYLSHDVPVLGPIGVAVTAISNVAVQAIAADSMRHGILFHNPNPATVLRILPLGPSLVAGQGGIVIVPYGFQEFYDSSGGNFGDDDSLVRVNCGWQVVADTAGAAGLTIWNWTDANPAVTLAPMPLAQQHLDVDIASPTAQAITNLTTVSSTIRNANQVRRGLYMHNPGSIYAKGIAPGNIAAAIGAGSIVLLPQASKEIRARGKIRINCAFNGVTQNNADPNLTLLTYL
jgi:hypothetical protein